MRIVDHNTVSVIRKQLLIRISYVLNKLGSQYTNKDAASYLNISASTYSQLKNYDPTSGRSPIRNLDRLFRLCEKLKINYQFIAECKDGKSFVKVDISTVVHWNNIDKRLPITAHSKRN